MLLRCVMVCVVEEPSFHKCFANLHVGKVLFASRQLMFKQPVHLPLERVGRVRTDEVTADRGVVRIVQVEFDGDFPMRQSILLVTKHQIDFADRDVAFTDLLRLSNDLHTTNML